MRQIKPGDVRCFLISENGNEWRYLRTYGGNGCKANSGGYHNAMLPQADGPSDNSWNTQDKKSYVDMFPKICECGHTFSDAEKHEQFFSVDQYVCADKPGELFNIRQAPPGAIWRNSWYEDMPSMCGTDGKSYTARTPDGWDWHIDGTASNCGSPNDKIHKCWCRHGEAPNFTVDKVGNTCSAGAGSIQTKSWHGFLKEGYFTTTP
jgi:hypothetical protein